MKKNGYKIINEALIESLILQYLAIFITQSVLIISMFKLAKRKSILEKKLTKKIQKVTGKKFLKVYIFPFKDKIQAFPSPTGEVFLTKTLYDMLDEDENLSVALHEAGHSIYQAHISTFAIGNILAYFLGQIHPALFLIAYSSMFLNMGIHERVADSYAKKMGYGKEMARALRKVMKNTSKDQFNLFGIFGKIVYKIDRLLHIHPHLKDRLKKLEDEDVKSAIRKGDIKKAKRAILK